MLASRADLLAMGDASRARLHGLRRHSVAHGLLVNRELQLATPCPLCGGRGRVAIKGMALHRAYEQGGYGSSTTVMCWCLQEHCGRLSESCPVGGSSRPTAFGRTTSSAGPCGSTRSRWPGRGSRRSICTGACLTSRLPRRPSSTRSRPEPRRPTFAVDDCLTPRRGLRHRSHPRVADDLQAALRMLIDLAVLLEDPRVTAALVDEVIGPLRLAPRWQQHYAPLRPRVSVLPLNWPRPSPATVVRSSLTSRRSPRTTPVWAPGS